MPELPEVENVRRLLHDNLQGYVVLDVKINRLDVIKSTHPKPQDRSKKMLVGGSLCGFHRHGKRLALEIDNGSVLEFSLGMSGQLIVQTETPKPPPKHAHLVWTLEHSSKGRRRLFWKDPRRFGGVWVWPGMDMMTDRKWSLIGVDALEIRPGEFKEKILSTRRSIKTALLDQNLIAGIGNIYADEALHRAGIRPRRMAARLRHLEIELLHGSIQSILTEAIEAGGSTIQSFKDPGGGEGRYQGAHAVYGRSGEPCHTCASALRTTSLNGRTTVWCQMCQK